MVAPFGALLNPGGKDVYFRFGEWFFFVGHTPFGVGFVDPADHFTVCRVARNDGKFARLGSVACFFGKKHAESAALFYTAVAANASFVQDGLHLRTEIDLFRFTGKEKA